MRENTFQFQPTGKILVFCNRKPAIPTVDPAIAQRIILLPFLHIFRGTASENTKLKDDLKAEYPRILHRIVAAAARFSTHGLVVPPSVRQATGAYIGEENHLVNFIADCCEVALDFELQAAEAHAGMRLWAHRSGGRFLSTRELKSGLEALGFQNQHKNYGSVFYGLKLAFKFRLDVLDYMKSARGRDRPKESATHPGVH